LLNANNAATAFTQKLVSTSALIPITFWLLMLAALLLPIDIAARRLTSLEIFAEGYQWLVTHLKLGNTAQLATSAGELSADTTVTVLDRLRTQRQQHRGSKTDQAEKHPMGKKKVTQAKPSGTETSNLNREVGSSTQSVPKESKPTQSTQPEISIAARLVEAKRKRQRKSE
jgi:hypothetical protein